MHRVALPEDRRTGLRHTAGQRAQQIAGSGCAHPRDEAEPPRLPPRTQGADEVGEVVGGRRGPDLHSDRISDRRGPPDVPVSELARALAEPEEVPAGRVQQVAASCHRFLEVPDQGLMRYEDAVSAVAEAPKMFQGVARSVVTGEQPPRVGPSSGSSRVEAVNSIAAIDRDLGAIR